MDGNDLMNDSIDEALFEQTIGSNGKWTIVQSFTMKRLYLHLQANVWECCMKSLHLRNVTCSVLLQRRKNYNMRTSEKTKTNIIWG